MSKRAYLGDAVYIEFDEHDRLILTTSNGITNTNTIILEFEVLRELIAYFKRNNLITS